MNHKRNAVRFAIAVFWLLMVGLAFTAISNAGNARALGWGAWLSYGIAATVVLYVGTFATKHFWRLGLVPERCGKCAHYVTDWDVDDERCWGACSHPAGEERTPGNAPNPRPLGDDDECTVPPDWCPLRRAENSAEWFRARSEEASLPRAPCFSCGGRLGCRADCDGLPMYASLSEPTAPKRPT